MSMTSFGAGLMASGSAHSTAGGIGSLLNDVTGKSASAKQQYKYALKLQKDAQEFSKWQMGNAHQMEIQDLQNAGLNPVLSAGGGGASAGVSANGASDGGSAIDPLAMIGQAVNMMNSVKQTNATVNNLEAETKNIEADTEYTKTQNKNASTKTTAAENAENAAKTWWGKNISPYLADIGQIFGGAGSGAIAGAAVANANTARQKIKTPKRNKIGF